MKNLEQELKDNRGIFYDLVKKSSNSDICLYRAIAEYLTNKENYNYCLDCDNESYNNDFPCYVNLAFNPIEKTYNLAKNIERKLKYDK